MRNRLAAALLVAAVALAAAGFALHDRGQTAAPPLPQRAPTTAGGTGDRVRPSPAEFAVAAKAGLVPADARSLLRVDHKMRYGEFVWNEHGVPAGQLRIFIDLRTQLISVFRAGHEIGSAVVLYGADGYETPLGEHPIRGKARHYQSLAYDAPMPFSLWLTEDGVAIHASEVRGGRATHGCIGVPPEFAELLFAAARVGDPVQVVRSADRSVATAAS
jgi:lipoprotein-anchoring transpeptidase ErfK/SrfK